MTVEQRNNGIRNVTVLTADDGKVLRRVVSGEIMGKELWLGYSYYIGGLLQNPPHLDMQSDFDEVDEPEDVELEPEEEDIPDDEALRIITGQEE